METLTDSTLRRLSLVGPAKLPGDSDEELPLDLVQELSQSSGPIVEPSASVVPAIGLVVPETPD